MRELHGSKYASQDVCVCVCVCSNGGTLSLMCMVSSCINMYQTATGVVVASYKTSFACLHAYLQIYFTKTDPSLEGHNHACRMDTFIGCMYLALPYTSAPLCCHGVTVVCYGFAVGLCASW